MDIPKNKVGSRPPVCFAESHGRPSRATPGRSTHNCQTLILRLRWLKDKPTTIVLLRFCRPSRSLAASAVNPAARARHLDSAATSAVVGIAHPDYGEAVTAAVVLRATAEALSEDELIARLKVQLAGYKVPKRIHFVADLPRNAMGKVQKNLLREKLTGN